MLEANVTFKVEGLVEHSPQSVSEKINTWEAFFVAREG